MVNNIILFLKEHNTMTLLLMSIVKYDLFQCKIINILKILLFYRGSMSSLMSANSKFPCVNNR